MTNDNELSEISGLVLIDKPAGFTSQDIVRKIKKIFNTKRVGHLGTLDPFASGLLPIMIGPTNRLASELMDSTKQYLFSIQLGIETDTLDMTGHVIKTAPIPHLNEEMILKVLASFTGDIQQTPPAYSALKMDGRPLYEHMRATGKLPYSIETKTRNVHIYSCELLDLKSYNCMQAASRDLAATTPTNQTSITIRVVCSKGTYVRSLARDIAISLSTVGSCLELRREKIGDWCVSQAFDGTQFIMSSRGLTERSNQTSHCSNLHFKNELFKKLLSSRQLLPHVPYLEFPEIYFDKLNAGNVFFVSPHEFELSCRDGLIAGSGIHSAKIFMSVANHPKVLFLGFAEQIYPSEQTRNIANFANPSSETLNGSGQNDVIKIKIRPKIRL